MVVPHEQSDVQGAAGLGSLGYRLAVVSRRARMAFEHRLAEAGASFATWTVLETLTVLGPMIQRDLADALDVRGQTLARHIDRLVSSGWVRRADVDGDRRALLLEVTDEGAAAHQRLASAADAANAQLTRGMSDREVETLDRLLGRMAENVQDDE